MKAKYTIKLLMASNGYLQMSSSWSKTYGKMLTRKTKFISFADVVWC